jgi:DNA modification methylase
MKTQLILGDCLEKLKELEDNSVDSIVTDPPYGLEFMGKAWDSFKTGRISKYKEGGSIDLEQIESRKGKGGAGPSYTKRAAKRCRTCGKQEWSGSPCKCETPDFEIDNSTQYTFQSFSEAWATECYRVLKPGGHLLAFGGSRMYHRLAVGVEDAGFEIRDQIMWIYGSGFPKSHNIGKSIDKMGGKTIGWFGKWLRQWREENKIAQKEIAKLFPSKTGGLTGCVANWELGLSMPTTEQFNTIIENFDLPFDNIEQLEREIIGTKSSACFGNETDRHTIGASKSVEVDITKGNSIGEGWGTALKPAHEPIVLARKPLIGTVADNVLEWGVGGLNIDGCRVGYANGFENEFSETYLKSGHSKDDTDGDIFNISGNKRNGVYVNQEGRFPANIIFECTCENPKVVADKYDIRTYNDYKNTYQSYEENDKDKGEYEIKDVETTKVIHTDPNCPCYILDQQSGTTKSSKRGEHNNKKTQHTNTYTPPNAMYSSNNTHGDTGGASRFFYCPKSSKRDRNEGCDGLPQKANVFMSPDSRMDKDQYERTSPGMERFKTEPKSNFHPTVKPTELMKYLIRLVTPKGGIVLDPFMGSGSTGKAAVLEGMEFIGIEREKEYFDIAEQRIGHVNKPKTYEKFFE